MSKTLQLSQKKRKKSGILTKLLRQLNCCSGANRASPRGEINLQSQPIPLQAVLDSDEEEENEIQEIFMKKKKQLMQFKDKIVKQVKDVIEQDLSYSEEDNSNESPFLTDEDLEEVDNLEEVTHKELSSRQTLRSTSLTFAKQQSWSKDEDKKLAQAADQYAGNWSKVAQTVNTNKDATDCYNRVHKMANGSKIGKWSEEMDAKVHQLYLKYRNNWNLIAKQIPGKTAK